MSTIENHIPPELRRAVNLYLGKRLKNYVISTSAAVLEIKGSVPRCEDVNDRELVNYIAERASEAGLAVSFDGRGLSQ